jgi:hypothetical protein
MRRPWSEHEDEATRRTPEGEARARGLAEVAERAYAMSRLASEGRVAWVSLPDGLPQQLIREGLAEQEGVAWLRSKGGEP